MIAERWPIPRNWRWKKAGDLAQIIGGGTPPADDESNFDDDGIPWLTPADLTGYQATYISRGRRGLSPKGLAACGARLMPAGTILYSSRAPIGYCVIAGNPIATNQGFKNFVLRGGDLPEFIRYYLIASKEYAESLASGTTFKELSGSRIAEMMIPIAPPDQQRDIVTRVDGLLARTANAREDLARIFRLAERYKQAILGAAFCGELTAEWRRINGPAQQRKPTDEVAVLRAQYFKNAKIREKPALAPSWIPSIEIPETWERVSVDQLATVVQYGTSAKTSDTVGVPILRMGNITDGKLDYRSLKYLPLNHSEFPELLLTDGDILFNRTNSAELVGKTAVYRDIGHLTSFASYLIRVRVVGYLPDLLSSYINSEYGRAWVSSVVSQQVGQANVNGTKLRELGVPIMSMDEQKQILSHVHRAFAHVDQAVAQTARSAGLLDRLEQAILEKAFRGKLVVAEEGEEQRDTRTETDR